MPLSDHVRSVEWVWAAWLLGLAALGAATTHAARRWRRPRWAELAGGEGGASYTLAYVLVAPLYLLFVCTVLEATLLIVAKFGTLYAAHRGARSAVVWRSAEPAGLREERPRQAVLAALAPFARAGARRPEAAPAGASEEAADFATALARYSGDDGPHGGLTRKYLGAAARTRVEVEADDARPDGDVTVTVTYRAPFLFPVLGRLFSPDRRAPYEYPIVSSVTLSNEAPVSESRTLGIDYESR